MFKKSVNLKESYTYYVKGIILGVTGTQMITFRTERRKQDPNFLIQEDFDGGGSLTLGLGDCEA